jgi:hypothetical protein
MLVWRLLLSKDYPLPYIKAETLRELQVLLQLTGLSRWVGNYLAENCSYKHSTKTRIFKGKELHDYVEMVMRDADFLRAILETSVLYVDMIEQSTLSNKQEKKSKAKPLKFSFCKCKDCENLKWIAHSNKRKRLVLVSKKAFEKELNNRANRGMGFFIIIYAMMRAYLQILHPYSKEKTIERKANRYFKKAMQVVAKDGLQVIMNKVSV